jgi:hypothetical protein
MNSLPLIIQCGTIASIAYFIKCRPHIYRNTQDNMIMTIRMDDSTVAFLHRYQIMNRKQLDMHSQDKYYRGEIILPF